MRPPLKNKTKRQQLNVDTHLSKDLVNEVNVSSRGQEDPLHHVVDAAVLLLDAAQAGAAEPPVGQGAAVGMAPLLLAARGRAGLQLRASVLASSAASLRTRKRTPT